ncbi:MAG: hypothetical protein VW258_13415, partial [Thalassolituus sp.]
MKVVLLVAALLTCVLPTHQALADATEDLHILRLQSTDAMTGFYMYQGLDADTKYANRIDRAMAAATAAMSRLTAGNERSADRASLETHWAAFQKLMKTNRADIIARGYPDMRLVNDMGEQVFALVDQAGLMMKTDAQPGAVPEVVRLARAMAFRMTDITSQYTGRGTSNLGQVFVGYQQTTPKEMAEEFDQLLVELEAAIPDSDRHAV